MGQRIDLVAVTADRTYEAVLGALLKRPKSIGIREVIFRPVPDYLGDSSGEAVELLRPFLDQSGHALVIRDFEGSGWDTPRSLEGKLNELLRANGWQEENSAAIVVEPEIENWLRLPSARLFALLSQRARPQARAGALARGSEAYRRTKGGGT